MTTVCIVTGAHLCRNPRVVKEATALGEAGYDVLVLGPAFEEELAAQDRAIARDAPWKHHIVVDLRAGVASSWKRGLLRLERRVATELVRRGGKQRAEALGYGMHRMLAEARAAEADLTIGHQEVGLWVARELMREGRRVGVDLEDWYSRDLLPEAQAKRPRALLEACEGEVLRHAAHVTTTSEALAEALAETYAAHRPAVVYNAFLWSDRELSRGTEADRSDLTRPSLHWVSQTIGPGRGLDTLCAALRQVTTRLDVHLRGYASPDDERWIRGLFPSDTGHRLFIHDLVAPQELLSRIAEHDIGIAVEEKEPPSRDLTVTNKILHYLLGGLAVVASDTAGQREVHAQAGPAIELCRSGDAESMAQGIERLAGAPERLAAAKTAALAVAQSTFCWEAQAPVLLEAVATALAPGSKSLVETR